MLHLTALLLLLQAAPAGRPETAYPKTPIRLHVAAGPSRATLSEPLHVWVEDLRSAAAADPGRFVLVGETGRADVSIRVEDRWDLRAPPQVIRSVVSVSYRAGSEVLPMTLHYRGTRAGPVSAILKYAPSMLARATRVVQGR
jgi:hypothetical protein